MEIRLSAHSYRYQRNALLPHSPTGQNTTTTTKCNIASSTKVVHFPAVKSSISDSGDPAIVSIPRDGTDSTITAAPLAMIVPMANIQVC